MSRQAAAHAGLNDRQLDPQSPEELTPMSTLYGAARAAGSDLSAG